MTNSTDPWHNLALEELLFSQPEDMTLYLWQNQNTVVIGRHQNAWKECRIQELEEDGGRLARRTSGGGAVFHDLGNLNFTFVCPREMYDQKRQLGVIIDAVKALGIDAMFTGRNDIVTASGAKFSGNAFRLSNEAGLHHGTLLVAVDMDKLSRYLAPSKEKLASKGIDSVRSRVANLSSLADFTMPDLVAALTQAFGREYGEFERVDEASLDTAALLALTEKHASWDWRLGASPAFDIELFERFDWGELQLHITARSGLIEDIAVYSDSMDEAFIGRIAPALKGVRFQSDAMAQALLPLGGDAASVADWLTGKGF